MLSSAIFLNSMCFALCHGTQGTTVMNNLCLVTLLAIF